MGCSPSQQRANSPQQNVVNTKPKMSHDNNNIPEDGCDKPPLDEATHLNGKKSSLGNLPTLELTSGTNAHQEHDDTGNQDKFSNEVQPKNSSTIVEDALTLDPTELSKHRTVSIVTDDGYNEIEDTDARADIDVVRIHDAMKSMNTNETELINVIVNAHATYRQLLTTKYKEKFDEDLVKDVKRYTSGLLQHFLVSFLLPIHDFMVSLMRDYIDEREYILLAELLTSSSYDDVKKAKELYFQVYESSFENDVLNTLDDLVSISLKDAVIPFCSLQREDNNQEPDDALVETEADLLSQGPDEISTLILQKSYSKSTLAAIFKCYKLKYYLDLTESIDIEYHGDTKIFITTIVKISEDAPKYFVTQIINAVKDEEKKRILNIFILRHMVDLPAISALYSDSNTLLSDCESVFSGDCERAVTFFLRKYAT